MPHHHLISKESNISLRPNLPSFFYLRGQIKNLLCLTTILVVLMVKCCRKEFWFYMLLPKPHTSFRFVLEVQKNISLLRMLAICLAARALETSSIIAQLGSISVWCQHLTLRVLVRSSSFSSLASSCSWCTMEPYVALRTETQSQRLNEEKKCIIQVPMGNAKKHSSYLHLLCNLRPEYQRINYALLYLSSCSLAPSSSLLFIFLSCLA